MKTPKNCNSCYYSEQPNCYVLIFPLDIWAYSINKISFNIKTIN